MLRQHVTDPATCIQCSACEMACPRSAIENILGRYCIDFDQCQGCGVCIRDCPTGAADTFVEVVSPISKDQQATWTVLPAGSE